MTVGRRSFRLLMKSFSGVPLLRICVAPAIDWRGIGRRPGSVDDLRSGATASDDEWRFLASGRELHVRRR